MGMSEFYGPADEAESRATLEMAVDRGVTFLDTADMYGAGKNEELLSDILRRRRKEIVLATKFGIVRDPAAPTDATRRKIIGKPDYVRSACEASLRRLKIDVIDLYYQHRVDPSTPIEETVGAMAQLVKEGKVRALGLSEATADLIRRAAAVHPIAALQSEYSLWTRDPEDGPLQTCRELGITLVPYSPLGRGFLTGQIRTPADFAADDFRRNNPALPGRELPEEPGAGGEGGGAGAAEGLHARAARAGLGDGAGRRRGAHPWYQAPEVTSRRTSARSRCGSPRRTWWASRRSSPRAPPSGPGTRRARWGPRPAPG